MSIYIIKIKYTHKGNLLHIDKKQDSILNLKKPL